MTLPKLHVRDLFWLVLVCACCCAWWLDRRRLTETEMAKQRDEQRELRQTMERNAGTLCNWLATHGDGSFAYFMGGELIIIDKNGNESHYD